MQGVSPFSLFCPTGLCDHAQIANHQRLRQLPQKIIGAMHLEEAETQTLSSRYISCLQKYRNTYGSLTSPELVFQQALAVAGEKLWKNVLSQKMTLDENVDVGNILCLLASLDLVYGGSVYLPAGEEYPVLGINSNVCMWTARKVVKESKTIIHNKGGEIEANSGSSQEKETTYWIFNEGINSVRLKEILTQDICFPADRLKLYVLLFQSVLNKNDPTYEETMQFMGNQELGGEQKSKKEVLLEALGLFKNLTISLQENFKTMVEEEVKFFFAELQEAREKLAEYAALQNLV